MWSRRRFFKTLCLAAAGALSRHSGWAEEARAGDENIEHTDAQWKQAGKGLAFCRVDILRGKQAVDAVAVLRVDPARNRIRVFQSFENAGTVVRTMEQWQSETAALALINGAQYMSDPFYMPCALVICDGVQKGPKNNKQVRGMLVAEPASGSLPAADVLDFDYDRFDPRTTPYTQGVQHWPILLDRKGIIKVNKTDLHANRSVVAKDFNGHILFFTSETDSFTLYDFGSFLKQSNSRKDGGFRIHTAMNLDGGDEANLMVKTESVSYLTSEAPQKPKEGTAAGLLGLKTKLPGVIGVFPRV